MTLSMLPLRMNIQESVPHPGALAHCLSCHFSPQETLTYPSGVLTELTQVTREYL